jgi:hypothetical protein
MGVAWASRGENILAVRHVERKNNFVSVSGNKASKLERRGVMSAKDLPRDAPELASGRSLARRRARCRISLDGLPHTPCCASSLLYLLSCKVRRLTDLDMFVAVKSFATSHLTKKRFSA